MINNNPTGNGMPIPAALAPCGFREVQVRGLNFRVFEQGQGAPLLLLHGFPDCLDLWAAMIPLLVNAGYRVIAFDQRGCGESDAPVGISHYQIPQLVDDAAAILDASGIKGPVYVMGHDWGAAVAWCFTLAYPERVQALVAVSVGHPKSYGRSGFEQKLLKGHYILWFQLRGLCEWYLLRAGGMRRWLGGANDYAEVMQRLSRPGRLRAGISWYRANFFSILRAAWPNARRPVLGIWSTQDRFLSEAQMIQSGRYVDADWQYQRVEGSSHWIPLEQPQQLMKLAHQWFSRHALTPEQQNI